MSVNGKAVVCLLTLCLGALVPSYSTAGLAASSSIFTLCTNYAFGNNEKLSCRDLSKSPIRCDTESCDERIMGHILSLTRRLNPENVVPVAKVIKSELEQYSDRTEGAAAIDAMKEYISVLQVLALAGELDSLTELDSNISEFDLNLIRDLVTYNTIRPKTFSPILDESKFSCWIQRSIVADGLMQENKFRKFAIATIMAELSAGVHRSCVLVAIRRFWNYFHYEQKHAYINWLQNRLADLVENHPRGKGVSYPDDLLLELALSIPGVADEAVLAERLVQMSLSFDALSDEWYVKRRAEQVGMLLNGSAATGDFGEVQSRPQSFSDDPHLGALAVWEDWLYIASVMNIYEIEAIIGVIEENIPRLGMPRGFVSDKYKVSLILALSDNEVFSSSSTLRFRALRLFQGGVPKKLDNFARETYKQLAPVQKIVFSVNFPGISDPTEVVGSLLPSDGKESWLDIAAAWNLAWYCLGTSPVYLGSPPSIAGIFDAHSDALSECVPFKEMQTSGQPAGD